MSHHSHQGASNEAPLVTADQLSTELDKFASSLREAKRNLSTEVGNIDQARAGILKQYDAEATKFITATIPDLTGDRFDTFARLADETPNLAEQGLSFVRQELTDARDKALQTVNATLKNTVDVAGFHEVAQNADQQVAAAKKVADDADDVVTGAKTALTKWNQTEGGHFVALNERLRSQGKLALSGDQKSRDYYDQKHVIPAMIAWLSRDASYREVRRELVKVDQGENGKDIFADMAGHIQKKGELDAAIKTANGQAETAHQAFQHVTEDTAVIIKAEKSIKTDKEILEVLQAKAAEFLRNSDFAKKVGEEYSEDFPHTIPLLAAKLATLDQLEKGANEKVLAIQKNIDEVVKQQKQAESFSGDTKFHYDLNGLRQQKAVLRSGYDNYAHATNESWNRAKSWNPPVTVYSQPDPLQTILLAEILASQQNQHAQASVPLTPYSADLFGVGKDSAHKFNLPDAAFNITVPAGSGITAVPDETFTILQGNPDGIGGNLQQAFDDPILPPPPPPPVQQPDEQFNIPSGNSGNSGLSEAFDIVTKVAETATESFDIGSSSKDESFDLGSSEPKEEKFDI
ncbi:MAG TPA: hypothetical protein VL625_01150 [Patescibacteria group bacterium]|nr:hypothetical protein [Patescibacteria group bacterium]